MSTRQRWDDEDLEGAVDRDYVKGHPGGTLYAQCSKCGGEIRPTSAPAPLCRACGESFVDRTIRQTAEAFDAKVMASLSAKQALGAALVTESKGLLRVDGRLDHLAYREDGLPKVLVHVHGADSVTFNCYSLPAAVALRVAQLLGEILR